MSMYDDESFSLEDLRAMRKNILEQRAKGVASWSYNGQAFTYSSPDVMYKVAEEITRVILRRMAAERGYVPVLPGGFGVFRPFAQNPNSGVSE